MRKKHPSVTLKDFNRPHLKKNKQLRGAGGEDQKNSRACAAGAAGEECRLTFPKFNLPLSAQSLISNFAKAVRLNCCSTGTDCGNNSASTHGLRKLTHKPGGLSTGSAVSVGGYESSLPYLFKAGGGRRAVGSWRLVREFPPGSLGMAGSC